MTEIMFETFEVPAYYLALQPVLSLHATGKTTGLVLDSGEDLTQVVAIYDGEVNKHAIQVHKFAGRYTTEYLRKVLNQDGLALNSSKETPIIVDIKEKLCYVALDYENEVNGK